MENSISLALPDAFSQINWWVAGLPAAAALLWVLWQFRHDGSKRTDALTTLLVTGLMTFSGVFLAAEVSGAWEAQQARARYTMRLEQVREEVHVLKDSTSVDSFFSQLVLPSGKSPAMKSLAHEPARAMLGWLVDDQSFAEAATPGFLANVLQIRSDLESFVAAEENPSLSRDQRLSALDHYWAALRLFDATLDIELRTQRGAIGKAAADAASEEDWRTYMGETISP